MQESLNFNFDTDAYIKEPETVSYNDLVIRGIGNIYRAGKVPRDF